MPRGVLVGGERADDGRGFLGTTLDRLAHLGSAGDLRAMFLRDGLRIVSDHPVLGVGPGRYGGAAATIIPTPVYEQYDTGLAGYRTVHNFWLHLLGEVGVVGTAVFLTMVAGLMIRIGRAARAASGLMFVVLAGAASVGLVVTLDSVTEMTFEGNMPILLGWLIFGIASTFAPARPLFARRP
jgi:O-antigen ligase